MSSPHPALIGHPSLFGKGEGPVAERFFCFAHCQDSNEFHLLAPLPFRRGRGARRAGWGLLLLFLLCCLPTHADNTLTVGSKRFPEAEILGEMLTQIANHTGEAKATHKQGLGNTGIVFNALKQGSIDVYPEYTGTISQELLKDKDATSLEAINAKLKPLGLAAGVPLGFNDGYGLAMRADQAQKLGITKISDLAKHPELHLGLSQEFLKRADGWEGVKQTYHLPFADPQGFDHGAGYQAIAAGQTDVVDVYTTDAEIQKFKLRVLADDRHYFPDYSAVLLYRADLPTRLPRTWAAISKLQGKISDTQMIALNALASSEHQTPSVIATNFLAQNLGIGKTVSTRVERNIWVLTFGGDFWRLTGQHLSLVFISLALSILVGVPLGIWAARSRAVAGPILGVVGLIQTIPSLALLVFFVPILSIGAKPTIAALFLYSLLPIVRNTYTGLTDIAPSLRESALALGLPPMARLRLIELPLASRSILAGIQTAAVINVGTATIAAFIGAGGYGDRINAGIATYDTPTLLSGAIPAALLALLVQFGFDLLARAVVPAGLRTSKKQ
jgi:osmoprotectant transport system permease protein